jgi:hypothetical protein
VQDGIFAIGQHIHGSLSKESTQQHMRAVSARAYEHVSFLNVEIVEVML